MSEEAGLREEMVRIGRLMYDRQLIVAAEGNVSARLGGDRFLVTPAGRCKGMLAAADLVVLDSSGRPAGRSPSASPSSEWRLHREIYAVRPDVAAVCHGHPPWATAFAAAGRALDDCLLPEIVATLGSVPLAPYATPGTEEVPRAARELIARHDALLLANHGVVAGGATLQEAFFRLETVERLAQITLLARLTGGERRLSGDEVAALFAAGANPRGEPGNWPCATATAAGSASPEPRLVIGATATSADALVEAIARGVLDALAQRPPPGG